MTRDDERRLDDLGQERALTLAREQQPENLPSVWLIKVLGVLVLILLALLIAAQMLHAYPIPTVIALAIVGGVGADQIIQRRTQP